MSETVLLMKACFEFSGCNNMNSDKCSCATWEPTLCAACGEELEDEVDIYALIRVIEMYPWLPEDSMQYEYENIYWHKSCDKGSLAADLAQS